MTPENERSIVQHLEELNKQIATQNSLARMFIAGIIYGIGFFVGSAIIATVAFGVLGPIIGKIPWIHDALTQGLMLRQ